MYSPIPNRWLLGSSSVIGYYRSVPQIGIIITFQPFGKDSKPTRYKGGKIPLSKISSGRRVIKANVANGEELEAPHKGWSQPALKTMRFQSLSMQGKNNLEHFKNWRCRYIGILNLSCIIEQQDTWNNNSWLTFKNSSVSRDEIWKRGFCVNTDSNLCVFCSCEEKGRFLFETKWTSVTKHQTYLGACGHGTIFQVCVHTY